MPKQKTKSAAKKRFALLKSGKIKRNKQGHRHILTKKTQKRKRNLRKGTYVSDAQNDMIRSLINA